MYRSHSSMQYETVQQVIPQIKDLSTASITALYTRTMPSFLSRFTYSLIFSHSVINLLAYGLYLVIRIITHTHSNTHTPSGSVVWSEWAGRLIMYLKVATACLIWSTTIVIFASERRWIIGNVCLLTSWVEADWYRFLSMQEKTCGAGHFGDECEVHLAQINSIHPLVIWPLTSGNLRSMTWTGFTGLDRFTEYLIHRWFPRNYVKI